MYLLIATLLIFMPWINQNQSTNETQNLEIQHVIVLGIDGLSPDGIRTADTPVMDRMINGGSHSFHARAVMPSSSGANWGSMIMGAPPEQHGIYDNNWRTDNFILPAVVTRNQDLFPTVFAVIRDQVPDAEIGAILDWNPISNYIERDVLSHEKLPSNEDQTTLEAVSYLTEKKPLFTFIHIDHVDGAGHRYGHGSPEYYLSVEKADSLIGEILEATKMAGIYENTVFIISADHGGVGYGHGGYTLAEMEIPYIIYGKSVKNGFQHRIPINVYDIPATVLFALGLDIPFEWIGRAVKSSFEGNPEPELMYRINHMVPDPIIYPEGEGFNPSGGFFESDSVTLEMKNPTERGSIHYTLDGTMPTSSSPIYDRPVAIDKNAVVQARIFEDGHSISNVNRAYFRLLKNRDGHGLRYSVYEVDDMVLLPDFSTLTPLHDGITYEISSNDLELTRQRHVAAVLEGYINIERMGRYTFYLASDDGSKLYINGNEIIDNDGDHGVLTKSGSMILPEGMHHVKVEWFNGGGGYWLGMFIEGPDLPRQIVPAHMLFLDAD